MAEFDPSLKYSDFVEITSELQPGVRQKKEVSIDAFRSSLLSDPYGIIELRINTIVDFFLLPAIFQNIITVPAGSIIKYLGLLIINQVVAGGTTVKLGLGQHTGGTTNAYGTTSDLNKGTRFSKLLASTILGADTTIDISGVTTAGTALGDTNISSGEVLFSLVADTPSPLPNP